MHEHADCLEQICSILKKDADLRKAVSFTQLLDLTPLKDEYFSWTPAGKDKKKQKNNSEQRSIRR